MVYSTHIPVGLESNLSLKRLLAARKLQHFFVSTYWVLLGKKTV